jgi:hypothetical protein
VNWFNAILTAGKTLDINDALSRHHAAAEAVNRETAISLVQEQNKVELCRPKLFAL